MQPRPVGTQLSLNSESSWSLQQIYQLGSRDMQLREGESARENDITCLNLCIIQRARHGQDSIRKRRLQQGVPNANKVCALKGRSIARNTTKKKHMYLGQLIHMCSRHVIYVGNRTAVQFRNQVLDPFYTVDAGMACCQPPAV